MTRRGFYRLVAILCLGGVLCTMYVTRRFKVEKARSDGILLGQMTHDFGVITVDNDLSVRLEHVFELRNSGGRVIEIREIVSSCSCAVGEPSTKHIEPGESVQISVALHPKKTGPTRQNITIVCADEQIFVLSVGTELQLGTGMWLDHTILSLSNRKPITFVVSLMLPEHQVPGVIEFSADDGIVFEPNDWELVYAGADVNRKISRWQSVVTTHLNCDDCQLNGESLVSIGDQDALLLIR